MLLQAISQTIQKEEYLYREQKDPHEFFIDLIQSICIENTLPNSLIAPYDHSTFENFRKLYFDNNPETFYGPITLFTMKKKIYTCQHSYSQYEGHTMYELSIDGNNQESIQDLINASISTKNLQENEFAICPECKKQSQ